MLSLFPLLGKRLDELSTSDLTKIAGKLNVKVVLTDELRAAGIALLKGQDIHTVSELVQKPESIQQLLGMFAPPVAKTEDMAQVKRCPHCGLFSFL